MNSPSPYTTHIRYEPGAPSKLSGWRRFVGKDARDHSIQNLHPAVAVNQIASQQPSKYGFLFKWKVKRVKIAPTNVKHDVGYFVTKDGYVSTNPPPAYVQATHPQPKSPLKRYNTIPPNTGSSPELSSRKSKRLSVPHVVYQAQHIPQSSSHVRSPPPPSPSPNHLYRSSSTKTNHGLHESGPAAPKKKVRWADAEPTERRRRSHSESHHLTDTNQDRLHQKDERGSVIYDPRYPTWEQYRQANRPPQQLPLHPSHSHSQSYPPPGAQEEAQPYVIPRQRRKTVPYHLMPAPVILVEQRR